MSAARSRDAVERMLLSKLGMEREHGDHRRYRLIVDGRTVAWTFVSTGGKYTTLGNDLITKMAKQLRVTAPFFVGLVDCPNTKQDYLQTLRDQGDL